MKDRYLVGNLQVDMIAMIRNTPPGSARSAPRSSRSETRRSGRLLGCCHPWSWGMLRLSQWIDSTSSSDLSTSMCAPGSATGSTCPPAKTTFPHYNFWKKPISCRLGSGRGLLETLQFHMFLLLIDGLWFFNLYVFFSFPFLLLMYKIPWSSFFVLASFSWIYGLNFSAWPQCPHFKR